MFALEERGTYDIDKEQWWLSSLTVFVVITEMTDLDCEQQWNIMHNHTLNCNVFTDRGSLAGNVH